MRISRIISFVFVGVFVLFAVGILTAQSHAKIDPQSIVGLWLFDDDDDDDIAKDSSENNHPGAIKGDPEWVEGKFGSALEFDGAGDFVDCGTDESLNLDVFTVTFWAQIPATQGWNHMVSKGSHVASGTPGSVNWGVMMRSGEARFLYEIYTDTGWTGISAPAIPLDEWQHMAATYDGDKMEFFLNGVSLESQVGVKIKLDASRSFRIGAIATAGDTPENFFNGCLDEVAFFNEVLSLDDILDIMNNGLEEGLGLTPVFPAGKSATTWARIKSQ